MRVIHFVPYFPPQRLGGVGEFVAGLHRTLGPAGVVSKVVTSGSPCGEPDVERIACRPLTWIARTTMWVPEASRYDIAHFQAGEAIPAMLMLRLRKNRPRILTTFHVSYAGVGAAFRPYTIGGRMFGCGLRPWIYRAVVAPLHRLVDGLAIRLSDAVNTISEQSARDVLGERSDDAHVVYYGLPDLPDPDPTADAVEVEPVELLYAGCGGHRKRVVTLPFVLERVREELPDARMRIVGFTRESEPEVAELFAARGLLAAVEFVGVKRSDELAPYYRSAGVLVVPSAYEGLPLVILEAMRSGLPVVATRVSGHPEAITDGVDGYLVDLDEPLQMAARCLQIVTDRGLRCRMGAAAQATIRRRFQLHREAEEYLALYRRLLNGGQAGE